MLALFKGQLKTRIEVRGNDSNALVIGKHACQRAVKLGCLIVSIQQMSASETHGRFVALKKAEVLFRRFYVHLITRAVVFRPALSHLMR